MKAWVLFPLVAALAGSAAGQDLNVDISLGEEPASMAHTVREIVIPAIDFTDTPIEDAIEFLRQKAAELDIMEPNPARRGINIILKSPPSWDPDHVSLDDPGAFSFAASTGSPRVTLKLKNVPISEAIRYTAEQAGLEVRIEPYAVVVEPQPEKVAGLVVSLVAFETTIAELEGEDLYEGRRHPERPAHLLEALQSVYRSFEELPAGDPRRAALEKKKKITAETIEKARKMLSEYVKKEQVLAEAWLEAMEGDAPSSP